MYCSRSRVRGSNEFAIDFHDVLYVEGLAANFLSTQVLKKQGLFSHNDEDDLFSKNDGTYCMR